VLVDLLSAKMGLVRVASENMRHRTENSESVSDRLGSANIMRS
jgi:hypothetical protein